MPRSQPSRKSINTKMQPGEKSTQRDRLVAGIVRVTNRDGYARASVAAVVAEAKVSKPTFYVYFRNLDDCFVGAWVGVHERLLEQVRAAITEQPAADATVIAMVTIVAFAGSEPGLARFLMNEPLAAGTPALDARDRGIADIASVIEEALESASPDASTPDVPLPRVIGGLYRLLASRLRRGEPATNELLEDIGDWIKRYEAPRREHRWSALKASPPLEPSPFLPKAQLRAPIALPPGRPRLSEAEVAVNQRRRIMFSAARLAEEKGYAATAVTEIAKRARVDLRTFYSLFAEKQEAFMAAHQLGFQEVMAVAALAFFAGATWPERSWEAGRAFTQFLELNPTIASIGFVEAYAAGPGAAQRIEDSHFAFKIFLQEGVHSVKSDPPSPIALEAIVATIFEIVYGEVRVGRSAEISRTLPQIAYLWLTPFLGPGAANRFIDDRGTVDVRATKVVKKRT
jgi:AcrR family transcriptional regulator